MSLQTHRFPTGILILLFLFTPICAEARKRSQRAKSNAVLELAEPDLLAAKAVAERKMTAPPVCEMTATEVNTRYREGIDVSHYQGHIDWDQVAGATKISYVYLKATEGASLVDDTYERNLREAKRVGLSVGSYHFYRPNVDWEKQFDNMTSVVKAGEQDIVPIIDIESKGRVSNEKFIADLEKFIKKVTKHYGKKPLLYTFQNFYNKYLIGCFSDYHWMIACYRDETPVLNDGKDYIIWQYTATGSIPGIRGNVDRSRVMGNYSLNQLGL